MLPNSKKNTVNLAAEQEENSETMPKDKKPEKIKKTGSIPIIFPANILVFFVFLLYLGAKYITEAKFLANTNPYLSISIIQICIYVLPCVFFCMLKGNTGFSSYKVKTFKLHTVPFVLTNVFLLFFLIVVLKYISIFVFKLYGSTMNVYSQSTDYVYVLLAGAFVPAITEEVLLRGVLFSEYEKVSGGAGAIFMTSLIFAMLHFSGQNFAVYFGAGLVLGIVTHVTGSVIPAMLLHFVNNFTMILTERTLFSIANENVGGFLALVLLLVVFLY